MEHGDKINYMRIATSIVGFNFDMKHLDLFVCLYDKIIEKKGETSIDDLTKVEISVNERHEKPKGVDEHLKGQ